MSANRQVQCPKCGHADAVRKVSSIVAEGTRTGETSGLGLGIGGNSRDFMAFVGTSTSRSELAARLAPPRKPSRPLGYGWAAAFSFGRLALALFVGLLLVIATLISFPFLINTYSKNPNLILIPIAAIVLFAVAAVGWLVRSTFYDVRARSDEHGAYEAKLNAWHRASAQWNNLYYCARDDEVFTLSKRNFLPLQPRSRMINRAEH